ncbi:MAG: hypothetical protein H6621_04915 [Halobacteriovoraceae bacterium]|nr:hypothetical protein [Halobacteriovoraceae bacterium]
MRCFLWGILLTSLLATVSCTKKGGSTGEKVLQLGTPAKVKGFDPIEASDLYSGNEVARVYEGLLQFHYLKRPYELVPNLAAEMPKVSNEGLTYTFKLKKGVLFHDNQCFPGTKGREMVAKDVEYSLKRLADPKLQSKGWWLLDGKIKGLNEWREKYSDAEKVNYEEEIPGMQVLDTYVIQFTLVKPFPQFLYAFAMPFTYVVPREAVEFYGDSFLNNPVGTGPFMTGQYTQANTIIYKKFHKYRDEYYPSEGAEGDEAAGLLKSAGKKIPFVDKIKVTIMPESQPMWLNFLKGNIDAMAIPKDNFNQAMVGGVLNEDFKKKGITEVKKVGLDVTFIAFNHENKLFKNNLKLRAAMSLAFDREFMNKNFYNGISIPAQSIIPPNIAGYIDGYVGPFQNFDLEKAKKLLAEAGYPEGKKLPEITYHFKYDTTGRQNAEAIKQMMGNIGINLKLIGVTWPELVKVVNTKQAMMYGMAWGADYPDAENFLQLLYSPNAAPGSNGSNYNDPEFDKKYEEAVVLPDGPERTKKYEELYKYAAEKVPLIYGFHRVNYVLEHGWFRNYKFIEFDHGVAKYWDIDLEAKDKLKPNL